MPNYDDYDDYNDPYYDFDKPKNKKSRKVAKSGPNLALLAGLGALFGILLRYTTAPAWVILGVLFWFVTVLTSLLNILLISSQFALAWYTLICGLPFYMLLVPGLILVMSYEEGRSKLAQRRPELRENFISVELYISNSALMTAISFIVVVIAGLSAFAQYEDTSIMNIVIWFSISAFAPMFTYGCARLAAAGVK